MPEAKRSVAQLSSRKRRLDNLFEGKRFTILREIHLSGDDVFQTPMGNLGQHGFLVEEEGNSEVKYCVGVKLLRLMHDVYGAVDLPQNG